MIEKGIWPQEFDDLPDYSGMAEEPIKEGPPKVAVPEHLRYLAYSEEVRKNG